jgi:hypothetical protein
MLINRVGIYFIWLGVGLIMLFVLSDIAQMPICNLLIFGMISLAVGIALWLRSPSPPPSPTARFRILRRAKKEEKK